VGSQGEASEGRSLMIDYRPLAHDWPPPRLAAAAASHRPWGWQRTRVAVFVLASVAWRLTTAAVAQVASAREQAQPPHDSWGSTRRPIVSSKGRGGERGVSVVCAARFDLRFTYVTPVLVKKY
jgi:hypothetical protein